jgi:hypothetical protein
MSLQRIKNSNHEFNEPLYTWNSISLSNKKSLNVFSSIACNTMIVSNNQRQEHNKQSHNPQSKTQGNSWMLQEPLVCKMLNPKCKPS